MNALCGGEIGVAVGTIVGIPVYMVSVLKLYEGCLIYAK